MTEWRDGYMIITPMQDKTDKTRQDKTDKPHHLVALLRRLPLRGALPPRRGVPHVRVGFHQRAHQRALDVGVQVDISETKRGVLSTG